jgi:CubicO group peptidase (beta-lactamase class C family)
MTPQQAIAGHVARGSVPGAVTLLARGSDVQIDAFGARSIGGAAMTRDTIVRIASMTKPITAAVALALVDDGTLRLDDPIDRWLPELADRRVLVRPDGPLAETVPARRAITVRDLLTFRLGFGMQWAGWQRPVPVVIAANELALGAFGPPHPQEPPAPDEWIRRFATLPLMAQPGERWMYNTGSEVLSVLVARASGGPFEAVMRERICEPLGMRDTAFFVPADKRGRLATSYLVTGSLELYDPVDGQWSSPPAFPSGAGGLVSTIDDFHAFARMLLAGGMHGATRVLSEPSVAEMTRDQLAHDEKRDGSLAPGFFAAHGWGFGVAIATARDEYGTPVGSYGWDGGLGTSWRTDPSTGAITILLTQASAYPDTWPVYRDFWAAASRA